MMAQVPEGIKLIVQGIQRFEILDAVQTSPYLRVKIRPIEEPSIADEDKLEVEALKRKIGEMFGRIVQLSPDLPDEMQSMPGNVQDPHVLTDLIAAQMPRLTFQERQEILETIDLLARMKRLLELLSREVQVLELGSRLQSEVAQELGKTQREYYLREHMRQIQKELGEGDDRTQEIDELREKIATCGMPEEARKEADRELDRLSRMNPAAPEYNVARTYLDWMVSMPWQVSSAGQPGYCRSQGGARRRPLRTGEGKRPDSGVSVGRKFKSGRHGAPADPLLRGTSRRRQDIARPVDRKGDGTQVRQHLAGRRSGRGGDPGASAHLHRRAARPDRSGHQARRDQQSCLYDG